MESSLLLPAFYLPPVSYFHVIQETEHPILLEQHEHFPKQTYRTRAKIATANGVLNLIVPIVHGGKVHVPMKDVRISYDSNWQRLHWLSLQTAYRSAAYFEYYEDDFVRLYEKKYNFLFDFNVEQLKLLLKCLKLGCSLGRNEKYSPVFGTVDYRSAIHPKKPSVWTEPKPYYQVFQETNGFLSDLSVVDLLFNQGPQSKSYL